MAVTIIIISILWLSFKVNVNVRHLIGTEQHVTVVLVDLWVHHVCHVHNVSMERVLLIMVWENVNVLNTVPYITRMNYSSR